ncbi:MAG: hypothetical protein IPL46_25660 [Saprospiraceae bacterium]|nr:hypothetical protein [Saprospiraceae bacterium]
MVQNKICETLIAIFFLTQLGCVAKLRVTLDIFDTYALEHSVPFIKTQVEDLCETAQQRLLRATTGALEEAFFADFDEAVTDLRKTTDFIIPEDAILGTKVDLSEAIQRTVSTAREEYAKAILNCSTLPPQTHEIQKLIFIMRQHVADGDQFIDTLKEDFCTALSGLNPNAPCQTYFGKSNFIQKLNAIQKRSIFGESIAGDQFASLITRSPEKYWQKYKTSVNMVQSDNLDAYETRAVKARFNRATVNTFFGNADVAIKMNSPASFTVKGVRLDADEAVKASFDVLQQGIKYLAYSSGIGVKDPATSSESTNTIAPLPEITENQQLQNQIERSEALMNTQYNAFLNVIFSQTQQISAEDSNRRMQALKSIQNAHTVLRANTDSLRINK